MRPAHGRRAAAVAALVLAGTAAVLPPTASAATGAMPYDFNGDGFADLVVGVPGEDHGSVPDGGAVNVVYGSAAGLTASNDQLWSQDSRGVPGKAEAGDRFSVPASGDFNRDGYADLAVGVPGESVGDRAGAGAVNVFYGSRHGLRSTGSRSFSQATRGVPGTAQAGDQFGSALVSGDFNGDHRADLAIGVPRDLVGPEPYDLGSVTVLLGGRKGLTTSGAQKFDVGPLVPTGIGGAGYGLDAADVNGDGRDELAVGASGVVALLVGDPEGLTTRGAEVWDDARVDIGAVLPKRGTIAAMALGDVNGDGHADLAVGSIGANISNNDEDDCSVMFECGGAVAIVPGSTDPSRLLDGAGRTVIDPNPLGLYGTIDFGRTLAAGDVDGDGRDELCVASKNNGDDRQVAAVHFAAGPAIAADRATTWGEHPGSVSGTFEQSDGFGDALQLAQYGRGRQADLAIAVPGETVDGHTEAGRVAVLYGSGAGLTATGQQSWSQDSPGIKGSAADGDRFGTLGR